MVIYLCGEQRNRSSQEAQVDDGVDVDSSSKYIDSVTFELTSLRADFAESKSPVPES